jgi:hypothetical protein
MPYISGVSGARNYVNPIPAPSPLTWEHNNVTRARLAAGYKSGNTLGSDSLRKDDLSRVPTHGTTNEAPPVTAKHPHTHPVTPTLTPIASDSNPRLSRSS